MLSGKPLEYYILETKSRLYFTALLNVLNWENVLSDMENDDPRGSRSISLSKFLRPPGMPVLQ